MYSKGFNYSGLVYWQQYANQILKWIKCGNEIETTKKLTSQRSGMWIIQGRIHSFEI